MSHYLLNTSLLLELLDAQSAIRPDIEDALARLQTRGSTCYLAEGSLEELWEALTRLPITNGYGYTLTRACLALARLRERFELLELRLDYAPSWVDVAAVYGLKGRDVRKAKLIATMLAHGVRHLLTLEPEEYPEIGGVHAVPLSQVLAE